MTARVRLALKRLESDLDGYTNATVGSQFAIFLADLAALIAYAKRTSRRKRV